MRRILESILGAACLLALVGLAAPAAAQQTSAAEAARRAREQQKQAPKARKVWTNDNLPTKPGGVTVSSGGGAVAAGEPGAAEAGATGVDTGAGAAGPMDEEEKQRAALEDKVKQAKETHARLKATLELLKRDYDLQVQQFSSNPGVNSDRAGRARVDALAAQVTAQTQQVAQAEEEVKKVEQELKELGERLGPKKAGPKTASQLQQDWVNRGRPLREELARIDGEIASLRAEATRQGVKLSPGVGGSPTADRLAQLETQRREVLAKIAALEDEARQAGVPASWIR
jgi:two-component sensor histidine kinase